MNQFKSFDVNDLWYQEEWNIIDDNERKFNDEKELQFWVETAPGYSKRYNLYRDVKGLPEWLQNNLGHNNKILEVGPGTGNFSIPLAKYSKEILAVDFSPAMIKELAMKVKNQNIKNISIIHSKWEDFEEPYDADFVLSVNSLYRVRELENALKKIINYGKKGFVIIRTVFKPHFHEIYDSLELNYKRNSDFIFIPMMLWNLGVYADVQYMQYYRQNQYANWEEVELQFKEELGEALFLKKCDNLHKHFLEQARRNEQCYVYSSRQDIEIISFFKNKKSI